MSEKQKINLISERSRQFAKDAIDRAPHGYQVELKEPSRLKTRQQLRTAFMWMHEIKQFFSDTCGKSYTDDQIRGWLNSLFLTAEVTEINGKEVETPISWARLPKDVMSQFMTQIDRYCASELGLYLTQPGRYTE